MDPNTDTDQAGRNGLVILVGDMVVVKAYRRAGTRTGDRNKTGHRMARTKTRRTCMTHNELANDWGKMAGIHTVSQGQGQAGNPRASVWQMEEKKTKINRA